MLLIYVLKCGNCLLAIFFYVIVTSFLFVLKMVQTVIYIPLNWNYYIFILGGQQIITIIILYDFFLLTVCNISNLNVKSYDFGIFFVLNTGNFFKY